MILPERSGSMHGRKITLIRASFNDLVEALQGKLKADGFVICGTLELKQPSINSSDGYRVLLVDLPRVSSKMLALSSDNNLILPASIVLRQTYGGVEVSVINLTAIIAAEEHNDPILYLALEVSDGIARLVDQLEREDNAAPDMITSWE